jgi:hypothetical protein
VLPARHVPKILLVTQGDPHSSGVAELFLGELASHYPPERLVRFTLTTGRTDDVPAGWWGFRSITRHIDDTVLPVASTWRHRSFVRRSAERLGDEIHRLIGEERIDLLWVVLNSGYMIALAERLSGGRTPMVGLVWDDPEYLARNHRLDPWTKRRLLRGFASVLGALRGVALVSDGMARLYGQKYGVRGIVMMPGMHPSRWRRGRRDATPRAAGTLGFAGSLVCKREWNSLVSALEAWNRTEPTRLSVRFIGRFPRLGARSAPFVEQVGALSLDDTLTQLASADVAYVPYWFDRRHALAARTAFPSKLSAYVAAGVPVLFHGPRESSPADFLRRYPVGLACHSLESQEIHRALRALLFDEALRATAARARERALEERLGSERMLECFAELLGIERAQLLPLRAAAPSGAPA